MEEENKVTLHGTWRSPYAKRVELALKLKAIPFKYVEEDLNNKSPLLLKYNPVNKKVPVLVHNGKAIAESLCIIEYIDENWKNSPQLLPEDPYRRAKVRFWTSFIHQQLYETMLTVMKANGEAQEKAIKELWEKLQVLEEGMKDIFLTGTPSIISNGSMGILEIVMCSLLGPYKLQAEVLGIKIIDPEKTPLVFSWLEAINELPLVKETAVPRDKTIALLKFVRENALKSSSA